MRIRSIVAAGLVAISVTIAGCALAERAFTSKGGEDSPAVAAAKGVRSVLPDPWGEVVLASIIALQNLWLARQKLKARKGRSAV